MKLRRPKAPKPMTLRPGSIYSLFAVALAVVTAIVVRVTATDGVTASTPLMRLAMIMVVVTLVFGLRQMLAASTVPVMVVLIVEAGLVDNPSWLRALVIGCLWFVTVEAGWEALDRRDGSHRTAGAIAQRVQEVATVVVVALLLGLIASVLNSLAPARTVLLQALVLGLVIGAFATLLRRVAVEPPEN